MEHIKPATHSYGSSGDIFVIDNTTKRINHNDKQGLLTALDNSDNELIVSVIMLLGNSYQWLICLDPSQFLVQLLCNVLQFHCHYPLYCYIYLTDILSNLFSHHHVT